MKTRLTTTAAALLVAGMSALVGCQSQPEGPPPQLLTFGEENQVYVTTIDLAESIVIGKPRERRTATMTEVEVPCTSLGNQRYILDYHFEWYDAEGFVIEPREGWREIIFEPGETQAFRGMTPSNQARWWRLEIRWANR